MATYHCLDCVHWHKMKNNISLYGNLLLLQIMLLKVQSFITLCISYNPPTRVAECIYIYIGAVTRMNYLPFAAKARLASYIPYSGYFTWGLNFVVFVVGKQNTKISDTKIKCTV